MRNDLNRRPLSLLRFPVWIWGAAAFVLISCIHGHGENDSSPRSLSLGSHTRDVDVDDSFRLLSWNVKAGALFPKSMPSPAGEEAGARVGRFERIMRAVRPDIVCLQEIWPKRGLDAVIELLNRTLPLGTNRRWQVYRGADVVIASPYALKMKTSELVIPHPLPEMPGFHYGQAMCLVDLPDDRFGQDLFVITTHYRSRSGRENELKRERHSESILRALRDLRLPGGKVNLPTGTPVLIAGDFNVYESNEDDPKRHLQMLITGESEVDISGEFSPDWDETDLTDLLPSINGRGREFYTWRNDRQPYPPGALDRVLFTDSVLRPVSSFVLDTASLEEEALASFGLKADDCYFAGRKGEYDHLPIIVDFAIENLVKTP